MAVALVAVGLGLPAFGFALWPLLRRRGTARLFAVPPDAREQLLEQKHRVLAALRELAFEHDAGHVSDEDHAELRARYEAEAAAVLTELDRLPPAPAATSARALAGASRTAWRHPLAIGAAAVALVVFGVGIGAGIVRYTTPEPASDTPMPGSRPFAPPVGVAGGPAARGGPITPEVLQGMLGAARASLFEGRYGEAIAAYQAVLKRDPRNVDAMTHLGLIVAIGGHADQALETLDRALAIDPNYAPAFLYRGQVLFEAKKDAPGAIRSWEKFLALVPGGEDHDRVVRMIAEAKAGR
ncbi:MAG: tetratricopeptide repeat protein [Candidatus Rokubacteria bacterium]|nr:tetratricopeptide repeat protein [Candidatus Rokubacteria bacterium]